MSRFKATMVIAPALLLVSATTAEGGARRGWIKQKWANNGGKASSQQAGAAEHYWGARASFTEIESVAQQYLTPLRTKAGHTYVIGFKGPAQVELYRTERDYERRKQRPAPVLTHRSVSMALSTGVAPSGAAAWARDVLSPCAPLAAQLRRGGRFDVWVKGAAFVDRPDGTFRIRFAADRNDTHTVTCQLHVRAPRQALRRVIAPAKVVKRRWNLRVGTRRRR